MTVRDIFELRKQGKIEEAYEAIRPMYAVHKGKYTSLCMFWTATDIFKLRLEQNRVDEATLIFQALKHVLPYINDSEGKSMAFMQYAARRLAKVTRSRCPSERSVDTTHTIPSGTLERVMNTAKEKHEANKEIDEVKPQKELLPCGKEISAISALSAGQEEKDIRDFCVTKEEQTEDYSGYLIVGLDEGIIDRPYDRITAPQTKVLDYIKSHEGCSVPKITAATGIPAKSVERHVSALIDKGLIEHRGSKKTGGYHAL